MSMVILQTILYFTPGEMAFMKVALPNSGYFEAFLSKITNFEKEYRKRFNLLKLSYLNELKSIKYISYTKAYVFSNIFFSEM